MPYAARTTAQERSVVDTVHRVFEAGQHLVLDRLELLCLDVTQTASRTVRGIVLTGAGVALLSGALVMLLAVCVTLLDRVMSLPAAIMLVGGVVAALGAIALMIGMQRTRLDAELSMPHPSIADGHGRGDSRQ